MEPQGDAGQRRHFPRRHADQREAAGHVRRQIQLEHLVAQVAEGHAHRGVFRQQDNALGAPAQPQLTFGADHAGGLDAADLARF